MSDTSPAASDPPYDVSQDHLSSGPKKRRRATIACRDCRLRKTKCDHIVHIEASNEMVRGTTKTAQMYASLSQRTRTFLCCCLHTPSDTFVLESTVCDILRSSRSYSRGHRDYRRTQVLHRSFHQPVTAINEGWSFYCCSDEQSTAPDYHFHEP
jgi:hypothetical protein